MILGRVWYQGEWSEAVVVWGSLGVHLVSGLLGRGAKIWERRERRKRRRGVVRDLVEKAGQGEARDLDLEGGNRILRGGNAEEKVEDDDDAGLKGEDTTLDITTSEGMATPEDQDVVPPPPVATTLLGPLTLHDLSGYALLLPLAHHTLLHRLLPSSGPSPISPSLLSYSFVSYSLSPSSPGGSPLRAVLSALSYATVLSLGTYHFLSGLRRILDPTAPPGLRTRKRRNKKGRIVNEGRAWGAAFGAVLVGVGIGVLRLGREGQLVPEWLGRRYELVLRRGWGLV